jgi:hypothetical protein
VPRRILLDIYDTLDRVHAVSIGALQRPSQQPLFLPIHIYEATTGKPVAVILRPADRRGAEVAPSPAHVCARHPAALAAQ